MKRKIIFGILLAMVLTFGIGCGSKEENVSVEESVAENVESMEIEEIIESMETEENIEETEKIVSEEETEEAIVSDEASASEKEETQPAEAAETMEQATEVQYTYTDMDITKYAKSKVNVRNLPDTSGDKLGGLNTNDEVHITGQCNETGWYRLEYGDSVAYVSNDFLVDDKIIVQKPGESIDSNISSNGGNEIKIRQLISVDYAGNKYTYPYHEGVVYGDGTISIENALGYAKSLGYDFDQIVTAEDGHRYYYFLSSRYRGVSGYTNNTFHFSQGHVYQVLHFDLNGGQFVVERVDEY